MDIVYRLFLSCGQRGQVGQSVSDDEKSYIKQKRKEE